MLYPLCIEHAETMVHLLVECHKFNSILISLSFFSLSSIIKFIVHFQNYFTPFLYEHILNTTIETIGHNLYGILEDLDLFEIILFLNITGI